MHRNAGDRGPGTLGDRVRAAAARVREDQREFLAADSRRRSRWADHVGEAAGDRPQHLVAVGVTVGVVDRLEVVEIEIDERQRVFLAPRPDRLGGEDLVEAAMVGQPGEGVCDRQVAKPRLLAVDQPKQAAESTRLPAPRATNSTAGSTADTASSSTQSHSRAKPGQRRAGARAPVLR